MIDDKKIEEAARYYCNNRYPASQDAPFIAEGFRHGAKWMREEFLKDLWHPASECDNNNLDDRVLLLAEDTQKNMSMVTGYDVKTSKPFYTKFLYLKDLLKGG